MSYSMHRQDDFVLHMMAGKAGQYLEIGANHPIMGNNTYLLEQNGWYGISIDIDASHATEWKASRRNELMITDALKLNFIDASRIDYLQLDIEPAQQTMQCLINMLATGCRFSIITFEHDAYNGNDDIRLFSRQLLEDNGYILAVPDVLSDFGPYEDWWIDSTSEINMDLLNTWR